MKNFLSTEEIKALLNDYKEKHKFQKVNHDWKVIAEISSGYRYGSECLVVIETSNPMEPTDNSSGVRFVAIEIHQSGVNTQSFFNEDSVYNRIHSYLIDAKKFDNDREFYANYKERKLKEVNANLNEMKSD